MILLIGKNDLSSENSRFRVVLGLGYLGIGLGLGYFMGSFYGYGAFWRIIVNKEILRSTKSHLVVFLGVFSKNMMFSRENGSFCGIFEGTYARKSTQNTCKKHQYN